jgi:hypothetical protein
MAVAQKDGLVGRRDFLKATGVGMAGIFGLYFGGCTIPGYYVPADQQVSKALVTSVSLGLKPGVSRLEGVVKALREIGVSNIASARGLDAKDENITIDAVTGDNMIEVLLFRNKVFYRSLSISVDAGTATRMYLHMAHTEGKNAVIVVSPDMTRDDRTVVAVLLDKEPQKRYFIGLKYFPQWGTRGMADPMINGSDLGGGGVTFVARGSDGFPWPKAFILKANGSEPIVKEKPMLETLDCDCLMQWYTKGR